MLAFRALLTQKYFMMYEPENKGIFESEEYLIRLKNPTTSTKRILSNDINFSRTICDFIHNSSNSNGKLYWYNYIFK